MRSRALLIGAQTGGLTGVENDVTSIAGALEERGFTATRCDGAAATRAGILAGYEELIGKAEPDDAVFVYYSGHGGSIPPAGSGTSGPALMDMQFIVPTDYHESTEDDFRGITSVELSVLLARLTVKTRNVVAAFDCCHAAHMSRDPQLRVKALAHPPTYPMLTAHIDRLRGRGLAVGLRRTLGNPDAVRIVACSPEQSAYEYTNGAGRRTGMLTEALALALAEAGALKVTWSTVMDRVRRRVLTLAPNQRPEAEGPSRRLLFAVEEGDPLATLPAVATRPGRVQLDGGRLLGVQVGDEFMIMPAGACAPDGATKIGTATVDRLGPVAALATLEPGPAPATVPPGARAHRTKAVAPAIPVRVPCSDPRTAGLVKALSTSTFVRVAEADDPAERWLADVRVDGAGRLTVHDRIGPLHEPRPADDAGVARVVRDLERLDRATAVRGLTEDPRWALEEPVTVEWGRLVAGRPSPLATSGAIVYAGERIYLKVRNDGRERVYVSLVDVGVAGAVTVLTAFSPSGVSLAPGTEYVFGWDDLTGLLTGVELTWPGELDPARARPETIVVLTTSEPTDVSLLEQDGVRHGRRLIRSPLEQALNQLATGGRRDLGPGAGPAVRYAVRTVDFDLSRSEPPPADEVAFTIDERPEPSMRLLSLRGDASRTVAVRLSELVVHRNRAAFGADIRVDAVVLTGGGPTAQPIYRAQTERFSNIRDGDQLPLDRMLVYHGPAVDYLDLAVWVSRDASGSLALSELLRDQLGTAETQEALARFGGLVATAPHAAVAAAALGAGVVIINVAYQLLRGAVGESVGLYRTTLLAHERFGVGRHPEEGVRRAQDFSFAYTVEDVT